MHTQIEIARVYLCECDISNIQNHSSKMSQHTNNPQLEKCTNILPRFETYEANLNNHMEAVGGEVCDVDLKMSTTNYSFSDQQRASMKCAQYMVDYLQKIVK